MGSSDNLASIVKNEIDCSRFIPYTCLVTENTVKLESGAYLQVMRLQGAAHESADPRDINSWHGQLNNFLRNIASPHVAIWTHVVRREYKEYPGGEFDQPFCKELNDKYREHMAAEVMMINELYVSIIYQPTPMKVGKFLDFLTPKSQESKIEEQKEAIATLENVVSASLASLDRYEPELLGCYEYNGHMFSELGEFLGFLVNGEWRRFPLPRNEVRNVLSTSRPLFGKTGLLALKAPTETYFGSILYIQEYPNPTHPGLLNGLLALPCEFVLSQSFTFLSKQVAIGRMQRQQDRLVNAGDLAASQVEEITDALDELVSNEWVMGTHHMALMLKSKSDKMLKDLINIAGTVLSDSGMKWGMEDLGLKGAFWSILPGNFEYRTRIGDITSRNFAGFSSFHNYPIGHIRNNQWGDAVCMFKTTSGAPYFFNFHKGENGSDAKRAASFDPEHKDLANTVVIGKSGTGKTALEMFLLAQTQKFSKNSPRGLSCVVFDKDEGAAVGVRAMGGKYFPIKNGKPTGWNPLQQKPTPNNWLFVETLIRQLAHRPHKPMTDKQVASISKAVRGVMNDDVPMSKRRLRSVLEFFDPEEDDGLFIRLSRWAGDGELAWLFDNEVDTLSIGDAPIIGFDVTDFLENAETRTPTIMFLFHRVNDLIDGRRIPIFMDEFPKLLNDPQFEELAGNKLVTIRKQDGFLVLFCQAPKQIMNSPIAYAIISQTATKIFLPNPEADFDDYVNGFKLTVREYEIVKSLGEKSRQFLIKQGENSVVAELNLRGFNDILAVLSSNINTSKLSQKLVDELGDDPAVWLPEFHRIRKGN